MAVERFSLMSAVYGYDLDQRSGGVRIFSTKLKLRVALHGALAVALYNSTSRQCDKIVTSRKQTYLMHRSTPTL